MRKIYVGEIMYAYGDSCSNGAFDLYTETAGFEDVEGAKDWIKSVVAARERPLNCYDIPVNDSRKIIDGAVVGNWYTLYRRESSGYVQRYSFSITERKL